MTTTYHCHLDVRGAIKWPKRRLAHLLLHPDGRKMSPDEARDALLDELSQGRECLPIGECDHFDFKSGCMGHRAPHDGAPA